MRELKFRAWNKKHGCYYDQIPVEEHGKRLLIIAQISTYSDFDPDDFIIEQFTGPKDKNGKDIYEGDKVRTSKEDGEQIGTVCFGKFESSHEAGYSKEHYHYGVFIKGEDGKQIFGYCGEDLNMDNLEIIGNIHEKD